MADTLAEQILLTISYTDQFQFPLTAAEVRLRLMANQLGSSNFSARAVVVSLTELVDQQLLETLDGYYCLAGQDAHIQRRQTKAKISQQKWYQIEKLSALVRFIPWIEGLFVTGSLAMNSAGENDDIDFLVITKSGRLWLSRILLVLLSGLVGKRRPWNADVKGLVAVRDSWCFNLWLDRDHLKTEKSRQDIYIAYEILQAKPVILKNNVWWHWISKNIWASEFIPLGYQAKQVEAENRNQAQSMGEKIFDLLDVLLDWPFSGLDWILFQLQYLYMKPHMTTERVSRGQAFFHPRNTKGILYQRWQYALVKLFARFARLRRQKIVLVTGVFDILHQEHIRFLQKAKQAGDKLIIGIESDVRVKQMKGENRPINAQHQRVENLVKLNLAEVVFTLPDEFSRPQDRELLISDLRPNILAVSSHTAHLDKKRSILKKYGGKVAIVHQHNPKISTTAILKSDQANNHFNEKKE